MFFSHRWTKARRNGKANLVREIQIYHYLVNSTLTFPTRNLSDVPFMKYLILASLCCLYTGVFAQTGNQTTDTLLDSARHYVYSDIVKSHNFVAELKREATAQDNKTALAYAHYVLGIIDEKHGDNPAALTNYERALEFADEAGDKLARVRVFIALSNYYINLSETDKAIEICHQGIREATAIDNSDAAAQFFNNLSLAHSYVLEYDKAVEYADRSIELKKQSSHEESLANAYLNKGYYLTEMGKYEEGFQYYELAIALYRKHNTYHALTQTYINYAWTYTDLKQFKRARAHLTRALEYAEKSADKIRQAGAWNAAGYYYRKAGYSDSVVYALQNGLRLSLEADHKRNALVAYQELSEFHRDVGNNALALRYLTDAYHLKDTIFDEAKIQLAQSLNARYEALQKEEEIKLLNAQQENDRLTIQKQRLTLVTIVLLGAATAVSLYLLFKRYRRRQEEEKQKELHQRKEAERLRIARDMHDEIGAGLTRIVMQSRQIKGQLHDTKEHANGVADVLDKLESESRNLSHNIGEIIWALNPQNDTLDTLCAYLRNYAYEFLEEAGIETKIDFPNDVPSKPVTPEVRRNIFLIVKESLNNLVKHAHATRAEISLALLNDELSITICDNGRGMNERADKSSGNGLKNMRKRTEEIGGDFSFISSNGSGMTIRIQNIKIENPTKV